MDTDEIALLESTLEDVIRTAGPGALRHALGDFGWGELFEQAAPTAVGAVAGLQGRYLTDESMLEDVLANTVEGLDLGVGTRFALPPLGRTDPASRLLTQDGRFATLDVDAVVSRRWASGDRVAVPAWRGDAVVLVVGDAAEWPDRETGLDPDSGWARLRGTVAMDTVEIVDGDRHPLWWEQLRIMALRSLAHELTGVGSAVLVLTVEHVTSRSQFGQVIAEFQAVKHKLADVRVWQETATLANQAAWEADDLTSAILAKTLANRFAASARIHGQQLLGGMGFTWEHQFHRYLRRSLLLEPLMGSSGALRREIGRGARERGSLPSYVTL